MTNLPPGAGPGWWLASDGQYYPPERHPDYRPPVPPPYAAAPNFTVKPRGRGKAVGIVAVALLCVGLGVGGFLILSAGGLPSIEEDKDALEAALPQPSDVPAGLSRVREEGGKDSSGAVNGFFGKECGSGLTVSKPRAAQAVEYTGSGPGDLRAATASSFEDEAVARKAHKLGIAAVFCFAQARGVEFERLPGVVAGADESGVYRISGIGDDVVMVIARADRYVVVGLATERDNATRMAELTVSRL